MSRSLRPAARLHPDDNFGDRALVDGQVPGGAGDLAKEESFRIGAVT
jgi:hypothetical protein